MTDQPRRLPAGSPCTMCGKCCTNPSYMGTLQASGDDVKRWRREGRDDILRFAVVLGSAKDPWADLWIDERGVERMRCPFVRKVRGQPRYRCTIYETRPQVCRDYQPWALDALCEVVQDDPPAAAGEIAEVKPAGKRQEPRKPYTLDTQARSSVRP